MIRNLSRNLLLLLIAALLLIATRPTFAQTPPDYTTGLILDLKASDVTGVTDGGTIASVTPSVGPTLTPANTHESPLYVASDFLGGKAGIHFGAGTSSYGRAFATTALTSSNGSYTIAFVLKADAGFASATTALLDISSARLLIGHNNGGSGFTYFCGGFSSIGSGITDTSAHVLIYTFDATSHLGTVYLDGASQGTGSYPGQSINSGASVIIGGDISATTNNSANAAYGEVRLYEGALSTGNAATLNSYLTAQYISAPTTATTLSLSAPATAPVGTAMALTVSTTGTLGSNTSVTLSDGGKGGTFATNPITLSAGSNPSTTVNYTPAAAGATTFTATATNFTSGTASTTILPAQQTIAVNDSHIYFSPQNWYKSGSSYAQSWNSNAYVKTVFSGTSFSLLVDPTTFASLIKPTIRVWVDNASPVDTQITNATSYVLASGLTSGSHTLRVAIVRTEQTADRWNGTNNTLRVTGFQIDQGASLSAPNILARKMAYFGDSITEGINVLSSNPDYGGTDGTLTFAALVANGLGAETCQVGDGGQQFIGGSTNGVPSFTSSWNYIQSGVPRDLTGFDYIFENLGTNGGIVASDLTTWMTTCRAAYPTIRIVIVIPFNGEVISGLREAIESGFAAYQSAHPSDTSVYLVDGGTAWDAVHSISGDSFDGLHYSAAGHQALYSIAQSQIAALAISVSSVSVSPGTATVAGGATQQFAATVAGANSPAQTVAWSTSAGSISGGGLFTAPAATSNVQTITITATSAVDGSVSGTATVTVPAATLPTAATPTFSPVAGTYSATQTVTIATSTSGASIYYTLDGSTPTTSSTLYSAAISVATSETIKAISHKASYNDSAVASAAYTISSGSNGSGSITLTSDQINAIAAAVVAQLQQSGAIVVKPLMVNGPLSVDASGSGQSDSFGNLTAHVGDTGSIDLVLRAGGSTSPIDLTGWTATGTVTTLSGTAVSSGISCTIVYAAGGVVRYPEQTADTAATGRYLLRIKLSGPGGQQRTVGPITEIVSP